MGKHERGYDRVERDLYPTPPWVVEALAEHVDLRGQVVWEPACGDGRMVEALRAAGARVYASDIVDRGNGQNEVLDFLSAREPKVDYDGMITNPPFGERGATAVAFIEAGLTRIRKGRCGLLALLLPCDFDSAKTRARHFRDCHDFVGKIVLTKRVAWFKRCDGKKEAPKENSAWFMWARNPLRMRRLPLILYAPQERAPP